VSAFRLVALICAGLAVASGFSAWLLIEGKKPGVAASAAKDSQVAPQEITQGISYEGRE
jgi:hypothetical protein